MISNQWVDELTKHPFISSNHHSLNMFNRKAWQSDLLDEVEEQASQRKEESKEPRAGIATSGEGKGLGGDEDR